MVRFIFLGLFLAAVAVPYAAGANEKPRFSESTLELCASEFAQFEQDWTAECLINAIRAWNVGALKELTADTRAFDCRRHRPCNEDFVFGPAPWSGAPMEKRSLFDMISAARAVTVDYVQGEDGSVEAVFYPGWGEEAHYPRPELTSANWMHSFFICKMEFEPSLGVWLIADGFCHSEMSDMPALHDPERNVEPLPDARNA